MKTYQRIAEAFLKARVGRTRAIEREGEEAIARFANILLEEGIPPARLPSPVVKLEPDIINSPLNKIVFRGEMRDGNVFHIVIRPALIDEISVQIVGQLGGGSRTGLVESLTNVLKGE